jgi:PhnB protein
MANKLTPYLTFGGNAREAMEFYQSVFGGNLNLRSFKDSGATQSPAQENLIMHGELIAEDGMTLMGCDDPEGKSYATSIALEGDDVENLNSYWSTLKDGATILAAIEVTPWGDTFGMLIDKFGIRWLINSTK